MHPETTIVSDWKQRLRADPRATLAALTRRLAGKRSEDPELEDLYWRALVDFGDARELAGALLARLRPAADARLLDVGREHRTRCHGRLRVEAAEELAAFRLEPAERARIAAHPLRLPETVYEPRGRPAEAAALYALEHDRLGERRDEFGALARAALRYKVARALHRVAEAPEATETARGIMESVLRLIAEIPEGERVVPGAAPGEDSPTMAVRLRFHAQEWLGLRSYEAERYAEAEERFLRAAALMPDSEPGVVVLIFAANALLRQGKRAEARRLLDSLQGRMGEVGDRAMTEGWEELYRRLEEELRDED